MPPLNVANQFSEAGACPLPNHETPEPKKQLIL